MKKVNNKTHVDLLQEALDTRLSVYNRLLADYLELKEAYETILDRQMENEMLIDKNAVLQKQLAELHIVTDNSVVISTLQQQVAELQEQLKVANEDAANLYTEAKYSRMFTNATLGSSVDVDTIPALEAHRTRIAKEN